jgi:LVIVD repeat
MRARFALLAACVLVLAFPVAASAHPAPTNIMGITLGNATASLTHSPPNDGGANFVTTRNLKLLGFSERRVAANDFSRFNTDLAFWRDRAFQGQFNGFRIIDIDDPRRPREILNYEECGTVGQGDIVVWGSVLVRAWDFGNPTAQTCAGENVPPFWEGVHVFDISDPRNPELMSSIQLQCGTHTLTGVPDLGNRRLLVYSTPSDANCDGFHVVEVPLSRPAESEFLRFEHAGRGAAGADGFPCHDTGVILGRANKVACAGGVGFAVWSVGGKDGGSRDNPRFLYNQALPEIRSENPPNTDFATGHSAAFSYDGDTIIFGHEPGGGLQARCKATGEVVTGGQLPGPSPRLQNDDMKSYFFFDTDSGKPLGKWTLTRPQLQTENCTLHNYNIVPTKHDDILVHGSYQSGIGVLDFSNPAKAREIAYADPAPLPPTSTGLTQDGGDWSSYFYNGIIYEADITRGLFTWRLDDHDTERAYKLRHLNPQTQEFTIGARKDHDRWNEGDRWHDDRWEDRD